MNVVPTRKSTKVILSLDKARKKLERKKIQEQFDIFIDNLGGYNYFDFVDIVNAFTLKPFVNSKKSNSDAFEMARSIFDTSAAALKYHNVEIHGTGYFEHPNVIVIQRLDEQHLFICKFDGNKVLEAQFMMAFEKVRKLFARTNMHNFPPSLTPREEKRPLQSNARLNEYFDAMVNMEKNFKEGIVGLNLVHNENNENNFVLGTNIGAGSISETMTGLFYFAKDALIKAGLLNTLVQVSIVNYNRFYLTFPINSQYYLTAIAFQDKIKGEYFEQAGFAFMNKIQNIDQKYSPLLRKRVIVIEDDEAICGLYKHQLSKEKYIDVQTFKTAEDALKDIQKNIPDLILLDIVLPGISGFEFLDLLRKDRRTSKTKVFVISTLDGSEDVENAYENYLIDEYIEKPFEIKKIIPRIKKALKN